MPDASLPRSASSFRSLLLRLRRQSRKGTAALESFASIGLILATVILIWGCAIVVYNQAIINGATELAASQALTIYDRLTYRGEPSGQAFSAAQVIANSVFAQASQNLLNDQFGSGDPQGEASISVDPLACATDYGQPFSPANCTGYGSARVEKLTVHSSSQTSIWFLTPLVNNSFVNNLLELGADGAAYSAGP